MLGIILIPVVILIAYGNGSLHQVIMYFGLGALLISFILKIGKGIVSVFQSGEIPLFYIILYLCPISNFPKDTT
jgi:hypothetical protein